MSNVTQTHSGLSPKIPDAPDFNTIPDPRAPSPITAGNRSPSTEKQHPDLSHEVAALSAKLITAINNQTNLDDALQETRHELEEARAYIAQLEEERRQHREALASGILVRRTETERKEEKLQKEMMEERKKRNSAERQKKGMESELESLTSQLFEEANQMVAAARHEKEKSDRRTDMYKAKVEETETLLASQQAQLKQLKDVLEEEQTKSRESVQPSNTAPSTPVMGANSERVSTSTIGRPTHTRNTLSTQSIPPPESPLHFDHLIHPVVRTDVQAYEDFVGLLRTNRGSTPPSRSTSGSYVGLNVLGLGSKDTTSQSTVIPSLRSVTRPSSRSTSAQVTPAPGGTNSPDPNAESSNATSIPLKDTKYYKRALAEDIEPTLRLDTAPGLSWLQRRTVLQSITTGRLIVEPFPPRHAFHSPVYSCSLCGEARTSEEHIRRYRFRASDSDEAQRHPVCDYCLTRLRSTCDFTSFLRMAKKGHMKNETVDECRGAWEECIKLREKMFWSRVGGGVVPAPGSNPVSPVNDGYPETDKESATLASRSDSDLPSISRADSQRTTSSEQPEMTPLSEVGAGEHLPSKETMPIDRLMFRKSVDNKQGSNGNRDTEQESAIGASDKRPSVDVSMPPPPRPEHGPTQAGTQDVEPVKRQSASSSRPSSSHASSRAFFEAKEAEARGAQAASSPITGADSSKRPATSTSRPGSSRASDKPSSFENEDVQLSSSASSRPNSNTFPRSSSSKPIKSFSFGPRDNRPVTVATESTATDKPTTDDTDSANVHHTTSSSATRHSTPAKLDSATAEPHHSGSSSPKRICSPSRPPANQAGDLSADDRRASEPDTSLAPLHIPGTALSKHQGPAQLPTQQLLGIEMPSPSAFTQLRNSRPASPVKEAPAFLPAQDTERRPRSSTNQNIDLHLDVPAQAGSKPSSKVAALASRFQQDDSAAQSRPGSSGRPTSSAGSFSRASGEAFRSAAASPERRSVDVRRGSTPFGSPERRGSEAKMPGGFV